MIKKRKPNSFADVIMLFPDTSVVSLSTLLKEKADTVYHWKNRDFIPTKHWKNLLKYADKLDLPITPEILIDLASKKR